MVTKYSEMNDWGGGGAYFFDCIDGVTDTV